MAKITTSRSNLGALSMQVFMDIKDQLSTGAFQPGDRLPTEKELCARFKVSHNTIRRAIGKLSEEGLLTVRQGSGTYVRDLPTRATRSKTISIMYGNMDEHFTSLHDTMMKHGYLTCVFPQVRSAWNLEIEREFFARIRQERHAGLLAFCSPHPPTNADALRELEQGGVRVVHIEHFQTTLPEQDHVLPDYVRAGTEAATRMILAGYDKLLYVTDNAKAPFSRMIQAGIETVLSRFGRPTSEEELVYEPLKPVRRRADAQALLQEQIRQAGDNVGVICDAADLGNLTYRLMGGTEAPIPETIGLIAIEPLGNPESAVSVDSLGFDRRQMLQTAFTHIIEDNPEPLRILTLPVYNTRGTVRDTASSAW